MSERHRQAAASGWTDLTPEQRRDRTAAARSARGRVVEVKDEIAELRVTFETALAQLRADLDEVRAERAERLAA